MPLAEALAGDLERGLLVGGIEGGEGLAKVANLFACLRRQEGWYFYK